MVSELRTENSENQRKSELRKNRCTFFFFFLNNRSDWYYNYKFLRETAAFEFDSPEVRASITTAVMPAFRFFSLKYLGNNY